MKNKKSNSYYLSLVLLLILFLPVFRVKAIDEVVNSQENETVEKYTKTINGKTKESVSSSDVFKIRLELRVPKEKTFSIIDALPNGFKYIMGLDKENIKVYDNMKQVIAFDQGINGEKENRIYNKKKEEVGTFQILDNKKITFEFNTEKLESDIIFIDFSAKMDFQLDNNGNIVSGPIIGNSGNQTSSLLSYIDSQTNETVNISFDVATIYTYGIQIINTDGANILTGGEFTVYKDASATDAVEKVVIGEDGSGKINFLVAGTYYIKQTKPPQNYQVNSEITSIYVGEIPTTERKVMARAAISNYSMATYANTVALTMPYTGSSETLIYITVGTLLILMSIVLMFIYKKKQMVNF